MVKKAPDITKVAWKFKTGAEVRSSPVVSGNRVYIGSNDGSIYCLDSKTGKKIWSFKTKGPVTSSPYVGKGRIIFGSDDAFIYALNSKDGKLEWKYKEQFLTPEGKKPEFQMDFFPRDNWDYYHSSPVSDGRNIYIGSWAGSVLGFDIKTGKVKWKFTTELVAPVRSSPALSKGKLYVGDWDGNIYSINPKTGKAIWKKAVNGAIQGTMAVSDDTVTFGSRDCNLYTFNAKDGKQVWNSSHDTSWCVTSPAISEGLVVAGSSDGRFVQAVDLKSGKEKWRVPLESNVFSSPAVSRGTVYVGCWDNKLYSLSLSTGKVKAAFETGGQIQSSPWVSEDAVYVGSDDGYVYKLKG